MKKIARAILAAALIAAIAFSGYRTLGIQGAYSGEASAREDVAVFKPALPDIEAAVAEKMKPSDRERPADTPDEENTDSKAPDGSDLHSGAQGGTSAAGRSIADLKARYGDAVGWITVPHTGIDYPFVQSDDNDYYLRRDINGKSARAGTIFIDKRCGKDFSDFNTILYGHNMKNGTMFSTLGRFGGKEFFEANRYGAIFLERATYAVEFFAFLVIRPEEHTVYNRPGSGADILGHLDYIRQNARQYRELDLGPADRVVTLSTCSYEFGDARMVLLGRLIEIDP